MIMRLEPLEDPRHKWKEGVTFRSSRIRGEGFSVPHFFQGCLCKSFGGCRYNGQMINFIYQSKIVCTLQN